MKDRYLTHGDFDDIIDLHSYWEKLNSKIENRLQATIQQYDKDVTKRKTLEIYLGIHEQKELERNKPIDKLKEFLENVYESRISDRKGVYIYPDKKCYDFFELGILKQ